MSNKKKRLESNNFSTSVFTLIAGALAFNGIEIDPEVIGAIGETLETGILLPLIIALPNIMNPLFKIYSKFKGNTWNWDFIKSSNFWTQSLTVIGAGLMAFTGLSDAWILAIIEVLNALNIAYHTYIKK